MDARSLPGSFEPEVWYVVFHVKSSIPWLNWLTPGRFKHVSAYAHVPGYRAWLVFDCQPQGFRLIHTQIAGIVDWTRGCTVVRMTRRERDGLNLGSRVLLWCGPSVRHLVGLKGWSPIPLHIYKACLREGGEIMFAPERALPPKVAPPIVADDAQVRISRAGNPC